MFPNLNKRHSSTKQLQRVIKRAQELMGVHAYIVINCDPQNPLSGKYQCSTNVLPNKQGEIISTYFKNPD